MNQTIKIGFLHTTPDTVVFVRKLFRQYGSRLAAMNFLDDFIKYDNFRLFDRTRAEQGLAPPVNCYRFADYARRLHEAGCVYIFSCCSMMASASEFASKVIGCPVIQFDAPAIEAAVDNHKKIGVIGTVRQAEPFIRRELQKRADAKEKEIEIVYRVNTELYDILATGNTDLHDEILVSEIMHMAKSDVDCIFLGQIPMGAVEDKIPREKLEKPVYCAGVSSMEYILKLTAENPEELSVKKEPYSYE